MLALAVVTMALVALFYHQAYSALRRGEWFLLYFLRMASIGIILLLLFQPLLRYERKLTDRRPLVFLIDTSASMSIADEAGGTPRIAQVISRLQQWLNRLEDQFEIRMIAFSDSASRVKRWDQLAELKATGKATSLSRALAAARRMAADGEIEAALLLSDGIDNSAGDPLQVAGRLGFPVHAIGMGNTLRDRQTYRDVRVTGLECPNPLFVDNKARLTGYVDASGFPGWVVHAVLRDGDQEVAEQELILDNVDGPQEVIFELTPTSKGLHTYMMEIPPMPEERIAENNQRSESTLVVDIRIRLLYLEGTLRAEYGALVGRFLSKDPALEFCALVQTRPNRFVQRSNTEGLRLTRIPDDPELLAKFDVFLLGDLDSTRFAPGTLEQICRRVRDGAGLLMMGGYHSLGPGGYAESPLKDLLPVVLGDRQIGQITDPLLPLLTSDGRRHPIFANIGQFFPSEDRPAAVEGLPPLQGCVRVLGTKPGGTVLAIHPTETARGAPMPLLVVQPVGKGRAGVFTGDTTRNWHQQLRAAGNISPFLRFWGQTVRWLAGRSEPIGTEQRIDVTTDKISYEPEAQVEISAIVRGPEGEAATQAKVTAIVRGADRKPVTLALEPTTGPAGHYHTIFVPQRSGRYEISVEATMGDTTWKADLLTIEVGRPYLEFDRLDLDDQTLIAIAHKTGGRYVHITTADRLIDRLKQDQRSRQTQSELSLSPPPLLWMLFVIVLTTEWLLRRRYQLR